MNGPTHIYHRLWFRLTAAFLLVALAGVVVVALLANRAAANEFSRFLNSGESSVWGGLQAELSELFAQQGDWAGAEALLTAAAGAGRGMGGVQITLVDPVGEVIAASGARRGMGGSTPLTLPIISDGQEVASLQVRGAGMGGGRAGELFLAGVNRAIWLGGLAAAVLAVALGGWLAYRLTQPLRELTHATQEMAAGRAPQPVAVADRGEIGELAAGFNRMAAGLAAAEQQRRQLLADVAHELRTPLSVLRGQLEAMLDGVQPLTPDNVAAANEEVILLGRLVEDLRILSLAEAGQLPLNRQPLDLAAAARRAAAAFMPLYEAEGVLLAVDAGETPTVLADAERMQQVLGNLLANALRYAPQGGNGAPAVRLVAAAEGGGVRLSVIDNGPGLSTEAQAHVFDRFWRGDRARNRSEGGSGLGLAICRAIVEAHGGRMRVESAPGQGTAFHAVLPEGRHGETVTRL